MEQTYEEVYGETYEAMVKRLDEEHLSSCISLSVLVEMGRCDALTFINGVNGKPALFYAPELGVHLFVDPEEVDRLSILGDNPLIPRTPQGGAYTIREDRITHE